MYDAFLAEEERKRIAAIKPKMDMDAVKNAAADAAARRERKRLEDEATTRLADEARQAKAYTQLLLTRLINPGAASDPAAPSSSADAVPKSFPGDGSGRPFPIARQNLARGEYALIGPTDAEELYYIVGVPTAGPHLGDVEVVKKTDAKDVTTEWITPAADWTLSKIPLWDDMSPNEQTIKRLQWESQKADGKFYAKARRNVKTRDKNKDREVFDATQQMKAKGIHAKQGSTQGSIVKVNVTIDAKICKTDKKTRHVQWEDFSLTRGQEAEVVEIGRWQEYSQHGAGVNMILVGKFTESTEQRVVIGLNDFGKVAINSAPTPTPPPAQNPAEDVELAD